MVTTPTPTPADAIGTSRAEFPSDGTPTTTPESPKSGSQAVMTTAMYPRFRLYTDDEIDEWSDPEWLIDRFIPSGAFALLHGDRGTGKSFVALDLALAIATGQAWQGRSVRSGSIVYVYAEGQGALKVRKRAWKAYRKIARVESARFVTLPVQLHRDGDIRAFVDAVMRALPDGPIRLIVIDTLARSFVGGDENSQKEMGLFVAGVDAIRRRTRAAVLVIHHDSRDSGRERGSSVLPAAADTIIATTAKEFRAKDGTARRVLLTLTCTKQKDADPFDPIKVQLLPVEVGRDAKDQPITSCVVVRPGREDDEPVTTAVSLSTGESTALKVLSLSHGGLTHKEWLAEWLKVSKLKKRTFSKVIKGIEPFVEKDGKKRGARYKLKRLLSLRVLIAILDPPDPIDWDHYETGGLDDTSPDPPLPATPPSVQ